MISFFPSRQVALEIFSFSIHWYGLLYLLSFLIAWWLTPRLFHYRNLQISTEDFSSILSAAILGVIIGGRLGYVLLYSPQYFLQNPAEIIAVWNGGMASHGGFLGVAIGLFVVLRKKNVPFLAFTDVATVSIALGLALGRFGNFINQELVGIATDLQWGMLSVGDDTVRHPVQFYALFKNVCIASVCLFHLRHSRYVGTTSGLFLVLYAILRWIVEEFREQPFGFVEILGVELSRGQLLTIPLFFMGLVVLTLCYRKKQSVS